MTTAAYPDYSSTFLKSSLFTNHNTSASAPENPVTPGVLESNCNFIPSYFVDTSGAVLTVSDDSISPLIEDLLKAEVESDMCSKLVKVFDKIAQSLQDLGNQSCQKLLVFKPSPSKGPSLPSPENHDTPVPDLVVLPPDADSSRLMQVETCINEDPKQPPLVITRFSWTVLLAVMEANLDTGWSGRQISQYLYTALGYRPDAINMLGMSCNKTGFRFYHVDASAQKTSQVFSWNGNLDKLVHFIYSLHVRYAEDIERDKSMELCRVDWRNENDTIYATPCWRSEFKGEMYQIQPIFQHNGRGRRSWIGVGTVIPQKDSESTKFRVVKDMWTDNSRQFEGDFLKRIHEKGYVPGVVRSINGGSLGLVTGNRTKHRLVMGSTGVRLSACKSVLEFLKIIYDAIEAHERVMEQGVLHRDISWYNVLCHPKHYIGRGEEVIDHPNIGKVLGKPDSQSLCLLTDFDTAAFIDDNGNAPEGTERTGTPMFMACELAYGKPAYRSFRSRPINTSLRQYVLEDTVLEKYTNVYGQERYDTFNKFLSSVLSGDFEEVDPFSPGKSFPPHQAHYDMESIYWIILWFLAKAWPLEAKDPYPGEDRDFQEALTTIIDSRRRPGHNMSEVIYILACSGNGKWEMALHPDFVSLAKMLSDMGDYICMCWSRFQSKDFNSCRWHSHEAFKRLLLKEIVRMTNDNDSMPIRGPRPAIHIRVQQLANAMPNVDSGTLGRLTGNDSPINGTLKSSRQISSRNSRSTERQQYENTTKPKRARSNSPFKQIKKPRRSDSDDLGSIRTSPEPLKFSLAQNFLKNIETDEEWFNES